MYNFKSTTYTDFCAVQHGRPVKITFFPAQAQNQLRNKTQETGEQC